VEENTFRINKRCALLSELWTKSNLTFNETKCVFSDSVDLLGYRISNSTLQPDPERTPGNAKEQQRIIGPFAYYAQWFFKYSDKIKPLIQNVSFPLEGETLPLEGETLKSFET